MAKKSNTRRVHATPGLYYTERLKSLIQPNLWVLQPWVLQVKQ